MHLDQVVRRLDLLGGQGLVYRLAPGATLGMMQKSEARLGVKFPEQVAAFWAAFDGLKVDTPPFKILSLEETKREGELIVFCICDQSVHIAFDVSKMNQAGQWSIINAKTGYCITYTMASFWSIHMWSWIVKHRPIWYDVHKSGDQLQVM
ncbi:MAG TPA: SMI1/KNR4 family protein [Terriglobales bacterium]|nr:SMI1/KNR4 family protein [Terriglobales bacterium]